MSIFDVVMVFLVFCVVWFLFNIAWRILETRLILKRQDAQLDALYSKGARLILKAVAEYRVFKREERGRVDE